MGFSYSMTGALCCDGCSREGSKETVRKRKCPEGYCQSAALCNECFKARKADGRWDRWHSDCAAKMTEVNDRAEIERRILDGGLALRSSAVGVSDDEVQVWFRYADKSVEIYIMPTRMYRAIPLLTPATIADFTAHGDESEVRLVPKEKEYAFLGK